MSNPNGITPENLLRTLPQVLQNDGTMQALATAIAGELALLSEQSALAALYTNLDALPEEMLDALAADFKVDWWSADYTPEEKRQTLKDSWYVHRHLGTKSAVERALSAIYADSEVTEWFEYDGKPYHFKLIIPVDQTTLDLNKHATVLSLVNYYKNLRSVLDDVEYHGSSSSAQFYGAIATTGWEIIDGSRVVNH